MKKRRFDTTMELSGLKVKGGNMFEGEKSSCMQCREIFEQIDRVREDFKDLGGGYEILQKIHEMESLHRETKVDLIKSCEGNGVCKSADISNESSYQFDYQWSLFGLKLVKLMADVERLVKDYEDSLPWKTD